MRFKNQFEIKVLHFIIHSGDNIEAMIKLIYLIYPKEF